MFQIGGAIHSLDIASGETKEVEIEWRGPRAQCRPHYTDLDDQLDDFRLHPDGHSGVALARGQVYEMPLFEGPAVQSGFGPSTVVHLVDYLANNDLVFLARDHSNSELSGSQFYVQTPGEQPKLMKLKADDGIEIGQPWEMKPSPVSRNIVAVTTR